MLYLSCRRLPGTARQAIQLAACHASFTRQGQPCSTASVSQGQIYIDLLYRTRSRPQHGMHASAAPTPLADTVHLCRVSFARHTFPDADLNPSIVAAALGPLLSPVWAHPREPGCRFAPNPGAATSTTGANGSSVYFLDRYYDNVRVERKGVTSVNWPKPKLKFYFDKKVRLGLEHSLCMMRGEPPAAWLHVELSGVVWGCWWAPLIVCPVQLGTMFSYVSCCVRSVP